MQVLDWLTVMARAGGLRNRLVQFSRRAHRQQALPPAVLHATLEVGFGASRGDGDVLNRELGCAVHVGQAVGLLAAWCWVAMGSME
jgi:hypothetical protein